MYIQNIYSTKRFQIQLVKKNWNDTRPIGILVNRYDVNQRRPAQLYIALANPPQRIVIKSKRIRAVLSRILKLYNVNVELSSTW